MDYRYIRTYIKTDVIATWHCSNNKIKYTGGGNNKVL